MNQSLFTVYLIDDDILEHQAVRQQLERHQLPCQFVVQSFSDVELFKQTLKNHKSPDIIIIDVHLNETTEQTGIELAEFVHQCTDRTLIVMRSMDLKTVHHSLLKGAHDFIFKNATDGELALRLYNAFHLVFPFQSNVNNQLSKPSKSKVVGQALKAIEQRIPRIIDSAVSSVHIAGESGVGKEVVAQMFANYLPSNVPFVSVNCAAITPSLLQSELFGHQKGAFTGAIADKKGLLESASGGWIFLDEIATLTLEAQAALLRVLESQEIIPVGGNKSKKVQIRIISATNESLSELVIQKKFRLDLWQRLRESEIIIPPLRKRPEEIKELIIHFCATLSGGPYKITDAATELLAHQSWQQGNVRQLRNCLRAMTENQINRLLTPLSIPTWLLKQSTLIYNSLSKEDEHQVDNKISVELDFNNIPPLEDLNDQLLLSLIKKLTAKEGRTSIRTLSKMIGISRSTLSRKIRESIDKGLASKEELSDLFDLRNAS